MTVQSALPECDNTVGNSQLQVLSPMHGRGYTKVTSKPSSGAGVVPCFCEGDCLRKWSK